jgi:hypothetical protein
MTTTNLLLKYAAFLGIGILLACAPWVQTRAAQPGARHDRTNPQITSVPGENSQGQGSIDYENAKPMPLPSLPDPAPSATPPVLPSPGEIPGQLGSAPGSLGTGEENPQVLVPPKPLSETNPN